MTVYAYDEIDEADYHRHPALPVSIAKNLLKPGGPAKVHWDMKHGRAASRAAGIIAIVGDADTAIAAEQAAGYFRDQLIDALETAVAK